MEELADGADVLLAESTFSDDQISLRASRTWPPGRCVTLALNPLLVPAGEHCAAGGAGRGPGGWANVVAANDLNRFGFPRRRVFPD